ncbi:uncharacterized protein [Eurosta solidaginis]|uniref:uncharacterized protein n=1 Tax=Eurosta solidaginis TaxID=178769 RepID=UPI00353166FD
MCARRSQVFFKMSSAWPRHAFYTITLLLLSSAAQRAASMSLERLGVDQNDLTNPATKTEEIDKSELNNSESVLIDDMELEAVPSNGNTDAYLLVPSGGLSERESVEKNMLENADDGLTNDAAEQLHPNEATDMLMVETNDAPLHVSLLGEMHAPELAAGETEDGGRMDEFYKQQIIPVIAVKVAEPQGSVEKIQSAPSSAEDNMNSEVMLSGDSESIGEVIAEAVLELKKDMDSAKLTDEAPINEEFAESENANDKEDVEKTEETAKQDSQDEERDAIESLSAMEENLMPDFEIMNLSEQVKSEENESDKTVEETELVENLNKDDLIEQSAGNEIHEEAASKPIQIEEHIEFVPLEEQAVKVEEGDTAIRSETKEKVIAIQEAAKLENTNEQSEIREMENNEEEGGKELTENEQNEHADEIRTNAYEEEMEVKPIDESMEKDVTVDTAGLIAEENKEEAAVEKEESKFVADKQGDVNTNEVAPETEENLQPVTDIVPIEDDQLAEESEMAEDTLAVYEPIEQEQNKLKSEATQVLDGDQLGEESKKQETSNGNEINEETLPSNEPSQVETMQQEDAIIEEILPIGEVAEISAAEDTATESFAEQDAAQENTDEQIALPVYNEPEADFNENNKQQAQMVDEVKQEEENNLETAESLIQEVTAEDNNKQELETEPQVEINEGLLESAQIMGEQLEEQETSQAQHEVFNMEEQKVTNNEEQAEDQNEQHEILEQPSEKEPEQEKVEEQQIQEETIEEVKAEKEQETGEQQLFSEATLEETKEQEQQSAEQIKEQQQENEIEQIKEEEKVMEEKPQIIEDLDEQQQTVEENIESTEEYVKEQQTPQNTEMQPIQIVHETLNADTMKPTNSLLTTIIQQMPQKPITPIKIENIESVSIIGDNSKQPPISAETSSLAPSNVMDSVLNYVNGSFMQFNTNNNMNSNNNKQQESMQKPTHDVDDDNDLNAQLRRYDGAQVWRIVVQNDHQRKMADELQTKYGGQLWKEVKQEVDYLLKPQVLTEAAQHVRAANLSRIVLIENLQEVIETENPTEAEIASFQNRKGHRLTWRAYHRLTDIHGFFDYMAKTYPDICAVETIGYSLQKRPLKILKISNGNANNSGIWIDGGMHAREWISPATVTFIANQLVEGWDDLPDYMHNINWYLHAVANPDGYEYTHTTDRLWRKNMRSHGRQCPGVDLNRNFGYKWGGKGTSANPCSQTYRGSKAFSEPETFYISKFISNYPRDTFQAYLSFHSYGQYILYPWGYDYLQTADQMDLDRVARQAGTTITKTSGGKYTVGNSATTLYPAAGGSDDWAKGFAGIKYAYTIEMGDTGRYGFVLPASHIEQNGKDGYTFVETVARAVTKGKRASRKRAF